MQKQNVLALKQNQENSHFDLVSNFWQKITEQRECKFCFQLLSGRTWFANTHFFLKALSPHA